ncbi:MAG: hypothetical protein R2697_09340 [Ilumatobacteraceae bacterium]
MNTGRRPTSGSHTARSCGWSRPSARSIVEQVHEAQSFFSEHPIEQAVQTLEQLLERQRVNARVRVANEDALRASLAD